MLTNDWLLPVSTNSNSDMQSIHLNSRRGRGGENTIFGNQLINKSYFLCLRWTGTDSPRSEWYISPDRINQAAEFAKSWLGGKQATLMIGWCTSVHNNDNQWKLFLNISEIFYNIFCKSCKFNIFMISRERLINLDNKIPADNMVWNVYSGVVYSELRGSGGNR